MCRIINSTYITLDGVIADPQDWPGNVIEPDGTGQKVQTDLLFGRDALPMGARTYPGMAAAWMARRAAAVGSPAVRRPGHHRT
jgi:hypothetical protein